jgi:FkbM family methyltransferase
MLGVLLATIVAGCDQGAPGYAGRDPLERGEKLYSQNNEELIVRDYFDDKRDGFFVDVGCYDYKDLSTTYYLEKHLGWSGIGVDANDVFRAGYAMHRPRTKFEHYAVTDTSGEELTFFINAGGEGVSSLSQRWIEDFVLAFFGPDVQPQILEVKVSSITLDDLLEKNGVEKIDFLSMDIEGHELTALTGFDIARFSPELICIEASAEPEALLRYFAENGYERIDQYLEYDYANWYFRPSDGR